MMFPNASDGIVERLKFWRDLPKGTALPDDATNTWDELIRAVCTDAITEIEKLRALLAFAGVVSTGPGLREIKDVQDPEGARLRPLRQGDRPDQAR